MTFKTKPKPKPKSKPGTKKTAVESSDEFNDDDGQWPCLECCEPFKNSRNGENGYCQIACI